VFELTGNQHRSHAFNAHILPRCQGLIRAIGYRMAYEAAACSETVTPEVLALLESICVMDDSSWYCENAALRRSELLERQVRSYEAALPQLDAMVEHSGAEAWVTTPSVSEEKMLGFLETLTGWSGALEGEMSTSSKL
jgi:acyl-CoA oxidase